MRAAIILILVLVFHIKLHCKLVLGSDDPKFALTHENLLADPFVQVEASSKHFNLDEYELTYLKLKETGKNKRNTFNRFTGKYKKITHALIRHQLIPHASSMIHTGTQMSFISKRREWEFSRVFVVYADPSTLKGILGLLDSYKLTVLKERLVVGYLNEKLLAIKAFSTAKSKLERYLKQRIGTDLEILNVVDIEIKGEKFVNEEAIEDELKRQHNDQSDQTQAEDQVKSKGKRLKDHDDEHLDDDVEIKVLFKVGEKQPDKEPDQDSDDEEEEETDSEDADIDEAVNYEDQQL